tara:strand:- start:1077 stop:1430 length:354 start_codon:yes stop_codon:yes gene_type:complete
MRTRLNALKNNATALKIPLTRLVKGKGRVPKTQARLKSDIADKRLYNLLSIRFKKLEKDSNKPGFKLTMSRLKLMKRYYQLALKMQRRGLLKRSDILADERIHKKVLLARLQRYVNE